LALVYLAYMLYEWNDLDGALAQVMEGIECCKRWGDFGLVVDGYLALARVQQARGDAAGVRDAIADARRPIEDAIAKARRMAMQARTDDIAWETYRIEATQAHLWLIQGDVEAVTRWVTRQVREGKLGDDDIHMHLVLPWLLIVQGEPEEALRLLALLLPRAETAVSVGMRIDVLAVQACAYLALGDTEQALATLAQALLLAEPGRYVRILVDKGPLMAELLSAFSHRSSLADPLRTYVNQLLAAFKGEHLDATASRALDLRPDTLKPETHLVEPLSERELDVLRLIAANLSNQEIADALFVSVNTIKTHVKRLYAKLNVHNRIAAIERAAELDLLPR
jgi:LuxR family maltose regulon positive regulatory protein